MLTIKFIFKTKIHYSFTNKQKIVYLDRKHIFFAFKLVWLSLTDASKNGIRFLFFMLRLHFGMFLFYENDNLSERYFIYQLVHQTLTELVYILIPFGINCKSSDNTTQNSWQNTFVCSCRIQGKNGWHLKETCHRR